MNYQEIYTDFYSKCYHRAEVLIKAFFIKRKSQKRVFGVSSNEVIHYLTFEFIEKYPIFKSEDFVKLHQMFCNRYRFYEIDQIQEILTNELKNEFDTITNSKLPINYNYIKLIKDIALIDAINEISRLLSNNNLLLGMMYKLNEFDNFEIREYKGIALEDTPIFKELHQKLYPEYYNDTKEITALSISAEANNQNNILSLFKSLEVYHCFLEYQKYILEFYSDYSYLKKRMEQEKLIHYHKDNDFMKIIFSDLKLISEKKYNEYCIIGKLKSLSKSYSIQRQNNFNIVFDAVL
jgi:hypothetical protein